MNISLSQTYILNEIAEERKRQIVHRGWTTDHDDGHTAAVWTAIFIKQLADYSRDTGLYGSEYSPEDARATLVQIAAIAVAALESFDRIHGDTIFDEEEDFDGEL